MRLRPPAVLIGLLLVVPWLACSAPSDSNEYRYVLPDASPAAAIGASCDDERPCGGNLVCRVPSECRRADPGVIPPASATGGRAGDRCDAERPCADGHSCETVSDRALCTRECARDEACPAGTVCWLDRGPAENWCVQPRGLLGASCELENDCAPGLFCENRAKGGYCSKRCDTGVPCPGGMDSICTRLSGDFGIYCLQRCTADREACRDDITCTKMTKADEHVCFPDF